MHGSGGDTFQMIIFDLISIIFDLINSLFKCWSMFEFFYFNYAIHTKQIICFVKGCSNFRNKELRWKLSWYFIDHFSRFWEEWFFWVDSNRFFFNLFDSWCYCLWKPSIIILVVQNFDQIAQTWPGVWSHRNIHRIKFQKWE